MAINLFPARVPIGRVIDSNGKERDVLMTPEFSRALADVLQRIGGPAGLGTDDMLVLQAFDTEPVDTSAAVQAAALAAGAPDLGAQVAAMRSEIDALRSELAMVQPLAAIGQQLEELRVMIGMADDGGAIAKAVSTSYAPLKSPAFIGTPTAPTAAVGTNTTQLATTAYALAMLGAPPAIGAVTPAAGAFTTLSGSAVFNVAPAVKATTATAAQASSLAATNSDSSQFLACYSGSSGTPTPAIFWRTGAELRFATATDVLTAGFTQLAQLDTAGWRVVGGLGCNGNAPQPPAVSGGTLAGVISALVAVGILSS